MLPPRCLSDTGFVSPDGFGYSAAGEVAMISDPVEFELDEMALTIFGTTYSGVPKNNMDYATAMFA
jgi:hypothetical protein